MSGDAESSSPERSTADAPRASVLEEKHMVSILMFLMENDGCRKTDLYDVVSYNIRMPDKLDRLETSGLITQERTRGRAVLIRLTDTGRRVGEELQRIEGMLATSESHGATGLGNSKE